MKSTSLVASALVGAALSISASASAIAPRPRPQPQPVPQPVAPSFESSLPRGSVVVASWNLPTDANNPRTVLAQVRSPQGSFSCVYAAVVNNAWVQHSFDQLPQDTARPHGCLDARQIANRWVFLKWELGGHEGTNGRRVDESTVEIFALVGGRIVRVYSGAVTADAPNQVASADPATLRLARDRRTTVLVGWAPDGSSLVERPATAPRRR